MLLYERYKHDLLRLINEWHVEVIQSYNARLSAQERKKHRTQSITLMTQISQKSIDIGNQRSKWNDLVD